MSCVQQISIARGFNLQAYYHERHAFFAIENAMSFGFVSQILGFGPALSLALLSYDGPWVKLYLAHDRRLPK
jgi:hypothetical protein